MVADGMSNEQMACQLTLGPLTVKTHVNQAMTKLGARATAPNSSFSRTRPAWSTRRVPGGELSRRRADDPGIGAGAAR